MRLIKDLIDLIVELAEPIFEWVISYPIPSVVILVLLIVWAVRGYRSL